MKCPIDGTALVIAARTGVEIDYCPQCRGVWLDRGELDKIIERSATYAAPPAPPADAEPEYYEDAVAEAPRRKKKRKGGFADILDDIFDF